MTLVEEKSDTITDWIGEVHTRSELAVERIPFEECKDWEWRDGVIVHRTGRFFSVRGVVVAADNPALDGLALPMIDQPEIGWLGFVVRAAAGGAPAVDWLLQAKTEPGSGNGTQVAPSVQASRSNFMRLHGGEPTLFLNRFTTARTMISDSAQSDQGSRFLGKFNRNSILAKSWDEEDDTDARWRWCTAADLRDALGRSMLVNTDARSVIATGPWVLLGSGSPIFTAQAFRDSFAAKIGPIDGVFKDVGRRPADGGMIWRACPVDALPGWDHGDTGTAAGAEMEARLSPAPGLAYARVHTLGREVSDWCQPFLTQATRGTATLVVAVDEDGLARALIRRTQEVGLGLRIEYGPTSQTGSAESPFIAELLGGRNTKRLCRIEQTDEGGRFLDARWIYRILLLKDAKKADFKRSPDHAWLTLSRLQYLLRHSGKATNELRTLVSLLLSTQCDEAMAAETGT